MSMCGWHSTSVMQWLWWFEWVLSHCDMALWGVDMGGGSGHGVAVVVGHDVIMVGR